MIGELPPLHNHEANMLSDRRLGLRLAPHRLVSTESGLHGVGRKFIRSATTLSWPFSRRLRIGPRTKSKENDFTAFQ